MHTLLHMEFAIGPTRSTLYVKKSCDAFLVIVVYIDDMFFTGPNEGHMLIS